MKSAALTRVLESKTSPGRSFYVIMGPSSSKLNLGLSKLWVSPPKRSDSSTRLAGDCASPRFSDQAQIRFAEILQTTKDEFARGLPFAMDPVVYQFAINEQGTWGSAETSLMPASYYRMMLPRLIREDASSMSATRANHVIDA